MNRPDASPKNSILIYTTEDGLTKIDTTFDGDTVWLSIDQMAELFQRDKSTISRHIKNIFAEGELERDSVVAKFATTAADGKTYQVEFYNLDVIISVGYRVKSKRGTQFRIWATGILKEYMRKGFALDDERLKNLGGGGYFKELLERIRDIRASEKVFYRQVLEIYATSIDYDPKAEISVQFFKKVQNKIHYAIHGQTAAEVIYNRADAEKEFMGLTTFAGNQPTLREATIAKNYLNEKELRTMGQLVSGYLDFAERQAEREQPMTMQDWANHLDRILTMSGEQLLVGNGSVTHKQAADKATTEYRKYKAKIHRAHRSSKCCTGCKASGTARPANKSSCRAGGCRAGCMPADKWSTPARGSAAGPKGSGTRNCRAPCPQRCGLRSGRGCCYPGRNLPARHNNASGRPG
jgi:hypothetical protein